MHLRLATDARFSGGGSLDGAEATIHPINKSALLTVNDVRCVDISNKRLRCRHPFDCPIRSNLNMRQRRSRGADRLAQPRQAMLLGASGIRLYLNYSLLALPEAPRAANLG